MSHIDATRHIRMSHATHECVTAHMNGSRPHMHGSRPHMHGSRPHMHETSHMSHMRHIWVTLHIWDDISWHLIYVMWLFHDISYMSYDSYMWCDYMRCSHITCLIYVMWLNEMSHIVTSHTNEWVISHMNDPYHIRMRPLIYGVATVSRIDKIICLFCRISSLL